MYSILGVIYLVFILLTMFLIVRDKKNSKKIGKSIEPNKSDKKVALLIILCTMLMYYIIGYIFNTDILNFITFRKNGVSFSFIGMGLLLITSLFIGYIIGKKFRSSDKFRVIFFHSLQYRSLPKTLQLITHFPSGK